MSGSYNIHNGVAQTNDTKAALDIGTMAAEGTINLVNQALNMHVTAVLNKGFSQSVGGTGVGGYLNTALANKNGELVLPVLITGNMNHPIVAPDVQQIAKMKLNNLLPTAGGMLNGKGGNNLGGLVGVLLGGQQQQRATAGEARAAGRQQQQPANPLGDALNSDHGRPEETLILDRLHLLRVRSDGDVPNLGLEELPAISDFLTSKTKAENRKNRKIAQESYL